MNQTEITIISPGLALLIEQEINRNLIPENLQRILKKAQFSADKNSLDHWLINSFSQHDVVGRDLPVAALRSKQSTVLCADPCYLHADRDQLLLFADDLDISEQEADHIIAAIQPLLDDHGAELIKSSAQQWHLELEQMPQLEFSAISTVSGKAVHDFLPNGEQQQRLNWLRLWNEIQMLLFELPLNDQRQQQGKLPINSLWFWGKGELNLADNNWQSVSGEHHLAKQLASQTNTSYQVKNDFSSQQYSAGRLLKLLEPINLEGEWQRQLNELDQALSHYWQSIKFNKINKLTLVIPAYGSYTVKPLDCWKFW